MRTIDPAIMRRQHRNRKSRWMFVPVVLVILGVAGFYWYGGHRQTSNFATQPSPSVPQVAGAKTEVTTKTNPKTFSANEFRDLYRQTLLTYPNTEEFVMPPYITGDQRADDHIRSIAEARGFQLTRMPVTSLVRLNEHMVSGEKDDLLQPAAFKAWQELKESAHKDNIPLALLSAYRSPDFQRDLFTDRLFAKGTNLLQIVALQGDSAIQQTLGVTAVPGYSRHHTGYTVDFWCDDGSGQFATSRCFRWLESDNYLHAKEAGWIPSYPEGADEQGPEPEPWEYVWVGRNSLFE